MDELDQDVQVFALARLCGQGRGRIRDLPGFLRGRHRVPESHDPAAAGFLDGIAAETVAARAEILHRELRATFGYRRRQLLLSQVGASASIAGPQFALRLWIEQDPDDPSGYVSAFELGGIRDPQVLLRPEFHRLFGPECSILRIDLPRPVDVLARVDALEEHPQLAGHLDYDPRGGWLSLLIPEDELRVTLTPQAISLSLIGGPALGRLIQRGRAAIAAIRRSGTDDLLAAQPPLGGT